MNGSTALYDAPGPRALLRNRIITVITLVSAAAIVAVVLAKLNAKGQLAAAKWEPFTTADLWRTYILPGAEGTLSAAALSIALASAFGMALAVGRMSPAAPTRCLCAAVVEFFRAVPVLILMIFAYFVYALNDAFPARQLALAGVVTGLTLYNAAVIAEIVRAGVHSLPRGQSEAAAALGLRHSHTMRLVLLPQAITAMLPALLSQLVVVLKDTAIGYQITFVEMVRQGTVVGSQYRNYLPALLVIVALMITVNVTLSGLATRLEARLPRYRRSAAPPTPAAAPLASNAVAGQARTGEITPA